MGGSGPICGGLSQGTVVVLPEGYLMTYENISKLFKSSNGGHFNHTSIMTGCNKVRDEGMLNSASAKGSGLPDLPEPLAVMCDCGKRCRSWHQHGTN